MAELQGLKVPGMFVFFSFSFSLLFYSYLFLVFSDPVLISSFKHRPQAWHIDSPLPNVYVNLLYLDGGLMTQFMVPAVNYTIMLSVSFSKNHQKSWKYLKQLNIILTITHISHSFSLSNLAFQSCRSSEQ